MANNERFMLRRLGKAAVSLVTTAVVITTPVGARATDRAATGADEASSISAKSKPKLTVTATSPAIVDVGDRVWLAGRATPGLKKRTVVLQQKAGSAWKRVGSSRVRADGSYRVAGTASRGGFEIPYRVKAVRSGKKRGAVSPVSRFTVYAWYPLTAMSPLTSPEENAHSVNFEKLASPRVDGKTYGSSWASRYAADGFDDLESGQGAFATATECTTLQATIGIDEGAGANASWQFLVYLDGNETNYGFKTKGDAERLTIDVTAVNRVRLANNRLTGPLGDQSYRGDAVWAGGRIKCAGRP